MGGAGAGEWERLNEVLRIGLKKAAPPLPPHVGRSFFLSPEPLTPIDNNPPDESSIRTARGGKTSTGHRRGTPHTTTQKSASGPNEQRPPPKDPNPTSQRTLPDASRPHRGSQRRAGRSRGTSPRAAPVAVRLAQALCRPTARRLTHGAPPSPASKSTTASTLSPAPITERWM